MSIPRNITREHLLKAIDKIDLEGIPPDGDSKYYDVLHLGKSYPPKLIVSYANIYANGKELDRNSFRGGLDSKCFELLTKNQFQIIEKSTNKMKISESNSKVYYSELIKFIKQSKGTDLATNNYLSNFQGLQVKVSFGKGNQARIPWIAFLNPPDTVQNGIYPVYLLYKQHDLLILAYGVSETNSPNRTWRIRNAETIQEYFSNNNLGKPERYNNSFVYKAYNLNNTIDENDINTDLLSLLNIYANNYANTQMNRASDFNCAAFFNSAINAGYYLSDTLCKRFVGSLLTKPFVILTGLAGSGKTKLAQTFVQWISQNESQYRIVPVGADWTNREPLLGYPNALESGKYVMPDSGVLELILHANNHPDLPHFLILDEMNLSHVERYFADFLSVMESGEKIPLFTGGASGNTVPTKLKVPSNLFIIGTVNIDETTNMFSPKVLDRANTIEFRVTPEEMTQFLGNTKPLDMDALVAKGADMAASFLNMASDRTVESNEEINNTLLKFFGELKKTGAEFGYRSATEILRLIHNLTVLDDKLSLNAKIDIAIMQKLLPKLHGSRRKLTPVLETLGTFCVSDEVKIIKDVFENAAFDFSGPNVLYPFSLDKIARMYKGAIDNGFASFAEA